MSADLGYLHPSSIHNIIMTHIVETFITYKSTKMLETDILFIRNCKTDNTFKKRHSYTQEG